MPIRVGVIGLEYGSQVHVPAFKEDARYELVAVCSRAPGRAEAVAREFNVPNWYSDSRSLINSNLDLISIATPPATHASYAAASLARGRHVISEIAFMPSAADARVVVEMAQKARRLGAAAYVLRYKPHLRLVSDLLAQGQIGLPRLMCFDYFSNVLAQPDDSRPWVWDADNGGGVLAGYVSHAIDLALRWFGPIAEVDGSLAALTTAPLPDNLRTIADDTGSVTLYFESGMLGVFRHSAVTAFTHTSIELHGTEGSLLIGGLGDEVSFLSTESDEPQVLYPPVEYVEQTRGRIGFAGAFSIFIDRLAVALAGDSFPPDLPTFADGLRVAQVVDAIRLSSRERRRVAVSEI